MMLRLPEVMTMLVTRAMLLSLPEVRTVLLSLSETMARPPHGLLSIPCLPETMARLRSQPQLLRLPMGFSIPGSRTRLPST